MVFIPEFKLGLLNGWLAFIVYLIVFGIAIFTKDKEVRKRLYDRSQWSPKQIKLTTVGKLLSAVNIIIMIFSPIIFNTLSFYIGLIIWILGLLGVTFSINTYSKTPLNKPVVKGLYTISRNPQIFSIWVLFFGILLMIGSGISLIIMAISLLFFHFSIIAEEESCLKQYGKSYREYMEKVPRYFLFF